MALALVISGLNLGFSHAEEASDGDATYYDERNLHIKSNISICGVDVGGLSYGEAVTKIEELSGKLKDTEVTLKSSFGDISTTMHDLGYFDDAEDAVKKAIELGNSGNILERYKESMQINEEGKDVPLTVSVREENLSNVVEGQLGSKIHVGNEYELTKNDDGTVSVKVTGSSSSVDLTATVEAIDSIVNTDWHGEAVTADIVINDGTSEKQQELNSIKDVLGEFTTNYSSASGRMKNIERATSLLNGTVLFPGQGLSVHSKISPITADNGYFDAPVYAGTKVQPGIGGGVCQVSTTLYNALLRAEVSITRRQNHGMTVHYVDLAMDAAISGTVKDLEFVNNLDAPIYIEGYCAGGYVTFKIYGKETRPSNRKLEFKSKTVQTLTPGEDQIIEDPTLPPGSRVKTQSAKTGYVAEYWKYVYVDGNLTESIKINTSTYNAVPAQISVNTSEAPEDTSESDTTETTEATQQQGTTETTVTPAQPSDNQPAETPTADSTTEQNATEQDDASGDVDEE